MWNRNCFALQRTRVHSWISGVCVVWSLVLCACFVDRIWSLGSVASLVAATLYHINHNKSHKSYTKVYLYIYNHDLFCVINCFALQRTRVHSWISGVCVVWSLVLCACFVDRWLSLCSFGHCVVCPSSISGFWLDLLYLQALLKPVLFY
jgi:hypothetical protein